MTKNRRGRPRLGIDRLDAIYRAEAAGLTVPEQAALLGELPDAKPEDWSAAEEAAQRTLYTNWRERRDRVRHGRPAYGLRLTLGGAPPTPHYVSGLRGEFSTGAVTGVGFTDEPSEDDAKRAGADPGCPVELVELSAGDCERYMASCAPSRVLVAAALARRSAAVESPTRRIQRVRARARELEHERVGALEREFPEELEAGYSPKRRDAPTE